jgi:hypothetical protein
VPALRWSGKHSVEIGTKFEQSSGALTIVDAYGQGLLLLWLQICNSMIVVMTMRLPDAARL